MSSSKEVVKMEEGVAGEEKEVYYPRRNGWNCPWHPLQVLAWTFIVFFTTTYFGFLVFYIPGAWRSIGYIVAGALFVTHILASLVTSTLDPAELSVRRKRPGKMGGFMRAVFDRKKHSRVIENHHCNLCEVQVSVTAKHCSVCDKCVEGFDHHCIWLNTCIGSRNYRWFMMTVFSALVACILLVIFTLSLFVSYFAGRESLRYACSDHFITSSSNTSCNDSIRFFVAEVPDVVFPILVAIIGLLAIVGVAMIGYLATFHIYLNVKGLSTYDYIVLQRRLQLEAAEQEVDREDRGIHGRCWCLRRKVNRVTPSDGNDAEKGQQKSEITAMASMTSVNSAGLVNFGRTPVQSVVGSSVGDVSLASNNSGSCTQSMTAADWMYDDTVSKGLKQQDTTQNVVIEMESQQLPAISSTTQASLERGLIGGDMIVQDMEKINYDDIESCGMLAFMSSVNSISPPSGVDDCPSLVEEKQCCDQESNAHDIESCGTLAFMSSANSITSSGVPTGTLITQEGDLHTGSFVCANSSLQGDVDVPVLVNPDPKREGVCVVGGVTPSASSESNKLREKQYEMLIKSGNTVGIRALRQLSRTTASTTSFSNSLCEGETASENQPTHLAWQSLPLAPIHGSLTAVPQQVPRFPASYI